MDENQIKEAISGMSDAELEALIENIESQKDEEEKCKVAFYRPTGPQDKFHRSKKKIKVFFGANMAGKTVAGAKEMVCCLIGYDPSGGTPDRVYTPPPIIAWVGAPDLKMAQNIQLAEVLHWLPKEEFLKYDRASQTLYLKCGSMMCLKSYDSDIMKWQSAALDACWLDEQCPYEMWLEVQSRVNRRNGNIWITVTPMYANSTWMYEELYLNRKNDPEIEFYEGDLESNIHLTPEMIQRQHVAYDDSPDAGARLRGQFLFRAGLIHPSFDKDVHTVAPFEFPKETRGKVWKFARVIDIHQDAPKVMSLFAYRDFADPMVYVIDELSIQGIHIADFGEIVLARTDMYPIEFNIIDSPESDDESALGTSMINQLSTILGGHLKANRSLSQGIEICNDYLIDKPKPKLMFFNNCSKHIADFRNYIWDTWSGRKRWERDPKEKPRKKDDHTVRNVHFFLLAAMPPLNWPREEIRRENRMHQVYQNRRLRTTHSA